VNNIQKAQDRAYPECVREDQNSTCYNKIYMKYERESLFFHVISRIIGVVGNEEVKEAREKKEDSNLNKMTERKQHVSNYQ
jgi:hypothetical protein